MNEYLKKYKIHLIFNILFSLNYNMLILMQCYNIFASTFILDTLNYKRLKRL